MDSREKKGELKTCLQKKVDSGLGALKSGLKGQCEHKTAFLSL